MTEGTGDGDRHIRLFADGIDRRKTLFFAIGGFFAVAVVCYLSFDLGYTLLIASFGASTAILFGTPGTITSRPRNVFFGHVLSAIIGVALYTLLGCTWYSVAFGVALAIVVMVVTDTFHPPGGATVVVTMTSAPTWSFVVMPVAVGILVIIAIAEATSWLYRRLSAPKTVTA